MRYYCTSLDSNQLTRGLALHRSLLDHAGAFELVILSFDAEVRKVVEERSLRQVRLLAVSDLIRRHPRLAAARGDRTEREFQRTCVSWLMQELLFEVPAGALLTYLDVNQAFFAAPDPVFNEIGEAPVAVVPMRNSPALISRDRFGRFNPGWISLRHNAVGHACVSDWAKKCADWCFDLVEPTRCNHQKYLDAWPERFPGTVSITQPGLLVAPWNVEESSLVAGKSGVRVNNHPLVSYDFRDLVDVGRGLYDPGLYSYETALTPKLRDHIYQPYLELLHANSPTATEMPALLPELDPADPRHALAITHLLRTLRETATARAASTATAEKSTRAAVAAMEAARTEVFEAKATAKRSLDRMHAADQERIAAERATMEIHVASQKSLEFLRAVEKDAADRLDSINVYQGKLATAYSDLDRNIAYLKKLEGEIDGHLRVIRERDATIASLQEHLARQPASKMAFSPDEIRTQLEPYARNLRRVIIAKYHPALLPHILWLTVMGVQVEVFHSPDHYAEGRKGSVRFWRESLWEWLAQIDSMFNEQAYLLANPDVAGAVASGALMSGWDHFQMFGQRERRNPGTSTYCSGIAEFDALAFDGSDASEILPMLMGRVQPHHKLIISNFEDSAWMPADAARARILDTTLVCYRPPVGWLGPRLPTNELGLNWPSPRHQDLYPARPPQSGEWPKITVVTVSYNQAEFLEETIRSVLDQNYPNLEYIIVDGASTDGSVEIIQRYAKRLTWWVSENDRGQSHALNKGFQRSTGQILTWLNSDDRLATASLFTVAQTFMLHRTDLVVGRCARVVDQDAIPNHVHRSSLPLGRIAPLRLDQLLDLDTHWLKGAFFHQPEVFFTRDIFVRAGGQVREDLYFSMDYDLWVRMAKAGAQAFALPEILAIFRQHARQKTGGVDAPYVPELREVNQAHRAVPATVT